jgi:formate dehydrogenase major subunit
MGCDPGVLTGSQNLQQARDRFEEIWGAPIPRSKGMSLIEMIDAAATGRLKALWAFGYDIYPTLPNIAETAKSLKNIELLIVQDLFLTETAKRFGTVFFPAASVFERDGTFMNSDRRVQRVRKAVEPPGEARPDAWIICELAQRLGGGNSFEFDDAEAIWNEVRKVWPAGAGLSYARIENESLHWPCPAEDHPGTPVLHSGEFELGKRTELRAIPYLPTTETVSEEYPYLLTTGRNLYHFNAGTMTYRTLNSVLQPTDYLDLSAEDASVFGIAEGDLVMVRSRYGEALLPARISGEVKRGMLFSTFHLPELFVNRLTSSVRDRYVKAPEYKVTAVALATTGRLTLTDPE